MVIVAQLVRAPDCGSGGHGFEPRLSPFKQRSAFGYAKGTFLFIHISIFAVERLLISINKK